MEKWIVIIKMVFALTGNVIEKPVDVVMFNTELACQQQMVMVVRAVTTGFTSTPEYLHMPLKQLTAECRAITITEEES